MSCLRGCCETQREHYLSITIHPAAMPNRHNVRYTSERDMEKRWNRDMPAFKQLVDEGITPPSVEGAAELRDRAVSKREIESGTILSKSERKEYEAVTDTKLES
jgi:hypothetical protein